MEILLTRHGQTDWNLLKKVQGKADIELNEKGIQQAETTRDFLKEERIDLILCSPLKRAIQTAETLLPLCLENCEVAKYSYKELDWER